MRKQFVMLVDDEADFLETITKRLQKRDLKVITADSGEAALDLLEQNRNLEVVILDVKMPGMDGLQVLSEIKRKHPLVEVIMLTGHATIESAIEGMKIGAFDYLMKPCDIEILLAKVDEAAEKKRLHAEKMEKARLEKFMVTHGI